MKTKMFVLAACLTGLGFSLSAQNTKGVRVPQEPAVTKGYYAIGKNAEKLYSRSNPISFSSESADVNAPKGYYAIKGNEKTSRQRIVLPKAKPFIRKGYYSIGNNADKL